MIPAGLTQPLRFTASFPNETLAEQTKALLDGGIDFATFCYRITSLVFPLESSAMCNKKAVQCTASFVISVHCFVQARQCTATTKATLTSGFLVAHCARDSGGMVGFCARRAQKALFQTHSALTDAVFYTKILDSNSPDFFGNFAADFGHAFDKDSKIVLKKPMNLK